MIVLLILLLARKCLHHLRSPRVLFSRFGEKQHVVTKEHDESCYTMEYIVISQRLSRSMQG